MAGLDNLNSGQLRDIFARLRALETAAAATNTAIGRAGMEVYDGGVIDITNGGLNVTGTATISGTLTGDGTMSWSGPSTFTGNVNLNGPTDINGALTVDGTATINGDTTVTGDFNVNGPMKTTGTLSVEGATSLKNNLTVEAGKKIILGGLTLENTGLGGGTLNFPSGSISQDTSFGMLLVDTSVIEIAAPTIKLSGMGSTTGVTANVYIDGSGNLKKIT